MEYCCHAWKFTWRSFLSGPPLWFLHSPCVWCSWFILEIRQYVPAWLMHSGFKLLGLSSSLHGGSSVSLHDWLALSLHGWAVSAWILCFALIRCWILAGSSVLLGWKSCPSLAVLSVLAWLASRHCWRCGLSEACLVARYVWLVFSFAWLSNVCLHEQLTLIVAVSFVLCCSALTGCLLGCAWILHDFSSPHWSTLFLGIQFGFGCLLGICYWPMSSSLLHGQAPELLACRCLFGWGTHGAAGFWMC
jgi:hypothetical protein